MARMSWYRKAWPCDDDCQNNCDHDDNMSRPRGCYRVLLASTRVLEGLQNGGVTGFEGEGVERGSR